MTAVGCFTLPHFVWSVGDITSHCAKKSTSFDLCGEKWILKLIHCNDCYGGKIEIFLKRISFRKSIQRMCFRTNTAFSNQSEENYNSMSVTIYVSDFNKWCVWSIQTSELYDLACLKIPTFLKKFGVLFTVVPPSGWYNFPIWNEATDANPVVSSESPDSLNNDIGQLFNSHVLSDVVLVCGDQRIYAHRAILSARSGVFAAMFRNDMKEAKETSVEITNMEPSTLELLIRFVYSGEVPDLSSDSVYKIYAAADMYGLETLKMKCGLFMMKDSETDKPDNVAAVAADGTETLKYRVICHFANVKRIIESEGWKQLSTQDPKLANDTFQFLVKRSPV